MRGPPPLPFSRPDSNQLRIHCGYPDRSPMEARWEPPASAGGATLQRRGKSPTSINRALAPASLGTPRLKPGLYSRKYNKINSSTEYWPCNTSRVTALVVRAHHPFSFVELQQIEEPS